MYRRLALGVPFLVLLVGCGVFSGSLGRSPSAVVKQFWAAANEGRYSDAEKLLSTKALNDIKGPLGQLVGGLKGAGVKADVDDLTPSAIKSLCDTISKKGQIKSVEILREEIRGETASVTARILYADGTSNANDVTQLIKERGQWRIAFGGI